MRQPSTAKQHAVASRQAVLYARVSSKEQEKEGFSIPAQLRLLQGYAAEQSLTVAREFIDVETAKQAGRASFGEMLAFLRRARTIKVLLVEKTDRLYRNLKDWVSIDELDLEVHFVKEGVVLSADSRSSEKFMHGIKVLMAKNYIDNLAEEVSKGLREKAEEGIWPSFAPLGYRNVLGPDGKRTIEPHPETAPLIVKLFEWYSTGQYSLKEVARMAGQAGFSYRKSGNPIITATADKILRKRIYTGDFDYGGRTYKGSYQPLISPELWQRVQDVLDDRFTMRPKKRRHEFAFSGLISCGHCGCALVGEIHKGRYVYYRCTGYRGRCPEPYTRQEVLEAQFADLLGRLRFEPEILDWVTTALRASHKDEKRIQEQSIRRLQAEVTKLDARLEAIYLDKIDAKINLAFYERKSAEWQAEREHLLVTIGGHQRAESAYFEDGVRLLELASRARGLFHSQAPTEKRKLLDFVLSNSSWKGGRLTATYRKPFDLISETVVKASELAQTEPLTVVDGAVSENWRRGRDSNPRGVAPYGISSAAPSTGLGDLSFSWATS